MMKARRFAGVSQGEMADYLGMTRQALSRYENGASVKLPILRLWVMRCGVPLEWLQSGDDGELRGRDSNSQPNGLAAVVQLRIPA
jgi:transcriptional regulator with XRE-family HTH domain